ncbi:hypothetical protein GCM10008026_05650 [Chelatococcus composti]|nr:hypothetical protein GCM10008026_05650 [Chelatococcus composti]
MPSWFLRNQSSTATCSRAPVPGMISETKDRPVPDERRSGERSWTCELPMMAASKAGSRPRLALAVRGP